MKRLQTLAGAIRKVLRKRISPRIRRRRLSLRDFPWIGSVSGKDSYPISEEHDRALGELDGW